MTRSAVTATNDVGSAHLLSSRPALQPRSRARPPGAGRRRHMSLLASGSGAFKEIETARRRCERFRAPCFGKSRKPAKQRATAAARMPRWTTRWATADGLRGHGGGSVRVAYGMLVDP